jgi:hypothetical protein
MCWSILDRRIVGKVISLRAAATLQGALQGVARAHQGFACVFASHLSDKFVFGFHGLAFSGVVATTSFTPPDTPKA